MARGKIDVWFIVRITPDVVTDPCIDIFFCCIEILFVAGDLINEGGLGNPDPAQIASDLVEYSAVFQSSGCDLAFAFNNSMSRCDIKTRG